MVVICKEKKKMTFFFVVESLVSFSTFFHIQVWIVNFLMEEKMLLILFKYCIKVIGVVFYDILFYHVKKDKVVLSLPYNLAVNQIQNNTFKKWFGRAYIPYQYEREKNIYWY